MHFLVRFYLLFCLCFVLVLRGASQVVYQDIYKTSVYDFLDELTNLQLIELNTLSKPYSRELIGTKLNDINADLLNKRQQKELAFFLKDFKKEIYSDKKFDKRYDLFYYKDSLFSVTINPIIGGQVWNNSNGNNIHRYSGGELFGSISKNWGFYASLRDNSTNEIFQSKDYLNNNQGANLKGSGDYSEMRGGVTYAWDWGSLGLIKDNITWGNNNFGSNIFSAKSPSFTRLELKLEPVKWFSFQYYHGWLASGVRDSSRSYSAGTRARIIDVNKYIAANFFTIKPIKNLYISIGNSIIYSDNIQPAFFIPFLFFKSIDHSIYSGSGNNGGGNSQMFFDVSSRNIKGIHLYAAVFIDETSFSRFFNKETHSNFISTKLGIQKSNLFNKNITITAEYTRTNPITYKHFVNSTTYESNGYTLGHHLKDNAQELAFQIQYKPIAKLRIELSYVLAEKGNTYQYLGTDKTVWGLPFLDEVRWKSSSLELACNFEVFNDVLLFVNYQHRKVSGADKSIYTYNYFQGETNTISSGLNIGF
jgi:hypothetical protein